MLISDKWKVFWFWSKLYIVDRNNFENGGTAAKYFNLSKGAHQGDPISAYLFILALEILFTLVKENPRITGFNIFKYCYSAYADGTTFFLKDVTSIKEMVNSFHIFSRFSGLRPNLRKCEIADIGGPKRGQSGSLWYTICRFSFGYH